MKEILDVIHKTIYQFFDVCEDDEEVPMSDKDKLLLEVNKAICNNLKALEQEPCGDCISRAEVLSTYADWYGYGYNDGFYRLVQQMKSVEPQESEDNA